MFLNIFLFVSVYNLIQPRDAASHTSREEPPIIFYKFVTSALPLSPLHSESTDLPFHLPQVPAVCSLTSLHPLPRDSRDPRAVVVCFVSLVSSHCLLVSLCVYRLIHIECNKSVNKWIWSSTKLLRLCVLIIIRSWCNGSISSFLSGIIDSA